VGVIEAGGRPGDHGQRELDRDPRSLRACPGEQRPQILAVDVLHRQEVDAAVLAHLEHLRDILMVQRRGESRLVQEHLDRGLVVRALRQDHLEHDVALEAPDPRGPANVDPRHPTRRDRREDLVLSETGR
jgi:hypothetical protein